MFDRETKILLDCCKYCIHERVCQRMESYSVDGTNCKWFIKNLKITQDLNDYRQKIILERKIK